MDGDTLFTIGDLARRTGLTVKTIRFYADSGIVPPTDRSPAGYRLYDLDALARLDLVRTLRELGLELAVGRALDAGLAPTSPGAAAVVDSLTARYAQTFDRADDAELRRWLLARLEIAVDPRAERYWHLLSVVNGWPVPPSLAPVFGWFTAALRAGGS
ncbi:MerR family transcriptional regulator [Kitasatospora purpeofusca]|uniref:MerR family transcriptional regulator n=1 Tax=Kitasatospora purpeofusca TaxID=67352 RepID=UPI0036C01A17